jgi:tetratricopeptide (TPR) repeat protein
MKNKVFFSLMAITISLFSCEKFLDEKSKKSLVVISTVADLQSLMDYNTNINEGEPCGPEVSSDNYYLTDVDFNAMDSDGYKRMYTWGKDDFYPAYPNEWSNSYRAVYIANTVIETAKQITVTPLELVRLNNALGQAHYHRAKSFYNIARTFSLAYDSQTASTDLGIPLRMESDFNIASERANNEETYRQIIQDLKTAIQLLPITQPTVLRPTKPAAYGFLSRVYLSMNKYSEAKLYADSCIAYNFKFLDYNTVNTSLTYPITRFNPEVIHDSHIGPGFPVNISISKVIPELYNQYATNDLRKIIFFRSNTGGTFSFRGGYLGTNALFGGVALDEVYLNRAECLARAGDVINALKDLNALLVNRFKTGTFVPYNGLSQSDALNLILIERRKELLMRCIRWSDIKRLNKLGANIVLKRNVNGTIYTLEPNSIRCALPLPEIIIARTGMPQNPR